MKPSVAALFTTSFDNIISLAIIIVRESNISSQEQLQGAVIDTYTVNFLLYYPRMNINQFQDGVIVSEKF